MRYFLARLLAVSAAGMACPCAEVAVSDPSGLWTVLGGTYDYLADQQTGQPAGDIVGVGANQGFFTTFNPNGAVSHTDGTLGFRLRLDAAGGPANKPAFDRVAWVGLDANADAVLDAFIGLGLQGSAEVLGIFAPGNSANTSPNTTSINSRPVTEYALTSANYNYRPVNYLTDGGTTNDVTASTTGDPDYYVSFMVPFADVVSFLTGRSIAVTDQSPLRYVVATSTQLNSLNQDLGGVNGGVNSSLSWGQLGGFSSFVDASGTPIPEPEPLALALAATGVLAACRRRAPPRTAERPWLPTENFPGEKIPCLGGDHG